MAMVKKISEKKKPQAIPVDKMKTGEIPEPFGPGPVLLPQGAPGAHAPATTSGEIGYKRFLLRDEMGRFVKRSEQKPSVNEQLQRSEGLVIDNELVPYEELARVWRFHKLIPSKDFSFVANAVRRRQRAIQLKPYQAELVQMQKYLIENKLKMIILFEGRDASGKGGVIRDVSRHMNQRHYRIVALGKPTEREASQWFYQKFISHFPSAGEIVLFDRSWYTRAMVERVFGFCSGKEYKDFMIGVTGFEKDLIRQDIILIKLYFSVTKEVQAVRFNRRKTDPLRQWKLSRVDLQAQDKWEEFTQVKYDMLKQTSIPVSPWYILRSDDKFTARLNAMKLILSHIPYKRLDEDLDFATDPEIVISGARELEILEAERLKNHLGHTDVII